MIRWYAIRVFATYHFPVKVYIWNLGFESCAWKHETYKIFLWKGWLLSWQVVDITDSVTVPFINLKFQTSNITMVFKHFSNSNDLPDKPGQGMLQTDSCSDLMHQNAKAYESTQLCVFFRLFCLSNFIGTLGSVLVLKHKPPTWQSRKS